MPQEQAKQYANNIVNDVERYTKLEPVAADLLRAIIRHNLTKVIPDAYYTPGQTPPNSDRPINHERE